MHLRLIQTQLQWFIPFVLKRIRSIETPLPMKTKKSFRLCWNSFELRKLFQENLWRPTNQNKFFRLGKQNVDEESQWSFWPSTPRFSVWDKMKVNFFPFDRVPESNFKPDSLFINWKQKKYEKIWKSKEKSRYKFFGKRIRFAGNYKFS